MRRNDSAAFAIAGYLAMPQASDCLGSRTAAETQMIAAFWPLNSEHWLIP
jgi:hypothetical protein